MPRSKNTTTSPPPASTPTLTTRLHELISACFTGIWVQTHEPHEAAREITDLCRRENWRLGIWNCDSGVQFPVEQIAIPGVTETQDPLAVIRAMPQVSQGSGTTVLLFENLHAIARAIVKRPEVLLCDEPTGALDYVTGKLVLEVIERVNRELGTTAVVITHNAAIASMADRVLHLGGGRIQRIDVNARKLTPAELSW